MSHDCDCDSCRESDSRWSYARKTARAIKEDCPKGMHVSSLWKSNGVNGAEYKCEHCNVNVTVDNKEIYSPVCNEHKRYKVKRKPVSKCENCWRAWLKKIEK